MHRVLILGAGKIGALVSGLLAESGSYRVRLADVDGAAAEAVARAHASGHLDALALDATREADLARQLGQVDAVISSLPYYCNAAVAAAARKAGVPVAHWLGFAARCEAKSSLSWDDPMPLPRAALHRAMQTFRSPR